ncbi:MAG TPA: SDR family oxidoreductase [Alphaproteobacteria bacterium]|nr:SDR family oxidoreductase [Alphaproteobacteria bacterium]
MTVDLKGRVAVVTGASRGLGRAMAMGLAEANGRVVLAARESEDLRAAAAEIAARAGADRVLAVAADITDQADCQRVVSETLARFGELDVLINNARRPHRGPGLPSDDHSVPFWQFDPEVWMDIMRVNVGGPFMLARAVVPHLIHKGWGRIINLSTNIDTMQRPHNSPYGVSKAAVEAATLIWAGDLKETGVTVNTILPGGACATELLRLAEANGRSGKLLPVDVMNPLAVWLASDLSDGKSGGRYVARFWDASLPADQAAARCLEAPVLRAPIR